VEQGDGERDQHDREARKYYYSVLTDGHNDLLW
jgi:hypothetical protein